MLKRLLIRFGVISPTKKICFIGPASYAEMMALARTLEQGRDYVDPPLSLFEFAVIRLDIDSEFVDVYVPSNMSSCFRAVREDLPYTPCGIVFMINSTNIEPMYDLRRELVSLVRDTKRLSQLILILVSTDNISSEEEEADLMAECDFQEMIVEEQGRIALFTYSLSSDNLIEGFHWLVKKMEM